MEMEVLFTYKNQLLASNGYTCVTITCQKVEWSRASASCLNLRTIKCPLFSNPLIKVALVGTTTALLLYRGAATFSSWRAQPVITAKKKRPNKNNEAAPRSGPAVSPPYHVVMDTRFVSLLRPRWLLLSSHLDGVTWMPSNTRSVRDCRNNACLVFSSD